MYIAGYTRVGNIEESERDFESICPSPPSSGLPPKLHPQSRTLKTHERTLLTTTGVHERALGRGAQHIIVIDNRIQLPHVSFTCLTTPKIIIMNVNNQHDYC